MIKANELRIGNLFFDREQRLCKCEKITKENYSILSVKGAITSFPIKPIPLTENLFIKCYIDDVKLECWGNKVVNENEYYTRYVLHNIIDGSSNIEIRAIHSDYGDRTHLEYKIYIDDEPQGYKELEYLHQLQNGIFWVTGNEITIKL